MTHDIIPPYIKTNVSLAPYTTFRIGGAAEYFVEVTDLAMLTGALAFARAQSLKLHIFGGGSNLLVADEGVEGLVIKIALKGISIKEEDSVVYLTCAAGEWWEDIVAAAVEAGWWGIENLASIPGTVGALPIQNVGAYGQEASQVIFAVDVIDSSTGNVVSLKNDECSFSYRTSIFKTEVGKNFIVTAVTLRLSKVPQPMIPYRDLAEYFFNTTNPTLLDIRNAVVSIRSKKFPDLHQYGTAGSFFKNPYVSNEEHERLVGLYAGLSGHREENGQYKLSAAWLIDNVLKLRGARIGSVGCYEGQALVIVNFGGAQARDVDAFAKKIEAEIFSTTGIALNREVIFVK